MSRSGYLTLLFVFSLARCNCQEEDQLISERVDSGTVAPPVADDEPEPDPELVPGLCVSPDVLDFGNVAIGQVARRSVTLSNCGASELEMQDATLVGTASGDFDLVEPFRLDGFDSVFPVGQAPITIEIEYAPTQEGRFFDADAPLLTFNAVGASASVRLNAVGEPEDVVVGPCELSAFPVANFATRDGVVQFGRVGVNANRVLPVQFTNSGTGECRIDGVAWDVDENTRAHEFYLLDDNSNRVEPGDIQRRILNPGESTEYAIEFAPTRTVEGEVLGLFNFGSYTPEKYGSDGDLLGSLGCSNPLTGLSSGCNGIRFVTNDTVSETQEGSGVFTFGLSATPVEPNIEVVPNPVDLGRVVVDCASAWETVTVYNVDTRDLVIDEPEFDSSNPSSGLFRLETAALSFPVTIPAGASFAIRVRVVPTDFGGVSTSLYIPTIEDGEVAPPFIVPVNAEGVSGGEVVDVFQQPLRPEVDVLLVVDDSGSMGASEPGELSTIDKLVSNFDLFFERAELADLDYHIAVTTTLSTDGNCLDVLGNQTCDTHELAGHHTACEGNEWRITQDTPGAEQTFECNVNVSRNANVNPSRPGSDAAESGMQAMRLFLSNPNIEGPNSGFLRPNAPLEVLIVSDEIDQSEGPVELYADFLTALKNGRRDQVGVGVVGVGRGTSVFDRCFRAGDDEDIGIRYENFVRSFNGIMQTVCQNDWSPVMSRLAADFPDSFALTQRPDSELISVCLLDDAGACSSVVSDFDYIADGNTIQFSPGSEPGAGKVIEVRYEAACLAE